MTIGVTSDTHGSVKVLRRILEVFRGADLIVHAGDVFYHPAKLGIPEGYDVQAFAELMNRLLIPVVIARGNCDGRVCDDLLEMPVLSPYALVQWQQTRIIACHGDLLSREEMIRLGRRFKAHYFISGHTHKPVLEDVGGLVLMNPGSPTISHFELEGRPVPTVGLIDHAGARILNLSDGNVIMEVSIR